MLGCLPSNPPPVCGGGLLGGCQELSSSAVRGHGGKEGFFWFGSYEQEEWEIREHQPLAALSWVLSWVPSCNSPVRWAEWWRLWQKSGGLPEASHVVDAFVEIWIWEFTAHSLDPHKMDLGWSWDFGRLCRGIPRPLLAARSGTWFLHI